jgi:hypothetical protein
MVHESTPSRVLCCARIRFHAVVETPQLLAQMEGKIGHHHGGPERWESAEQRAEKILNEELKRRGWDRKELKRRRKADPGKVQVAGRLRRETTMNWQWIAASLLMGAADYAAACVRELLNQS